MVKKLTIERDDEGWWVLDPNNEDVSRYGPYGTKAQAQEEKVGVTKFWRHCNKKGFITRDY